MKKRFSANSQTPQRIVDAATAGITVIDYDETRFEEKEIGEEK